MKAVDENKKINYLAETNARNRRLKFGIQAKDRTRHVYVIGKTGMGKSTLLENMAVQDIENGEGLAFIDPHGGTAEKLLDYIPENRIKDVIYFAPFDTDYPISFNVMEDVDPTKRYLVANGLMNAFKKIWVDAWSARMEYILNNILLALLEYPNSTLLGVNRMLSDKDYRDLVVSNVKDASVKAFWVDEFAKYGDRYMQEAGAAIQNKIGQFVSNPLIRNIIGQPKSSFDFRKVMDEKKIVILNLSKGRMGIENSALLGNMLVTKIYLAAMSRADVTASELVHLPNFYFYVDEFQSFANESFAEILSEARKYKLNLTIAHQYIEQMPEEVQAAVFGNVGTMIVFRVGSTDAEVFEKEFAPEYTAEDIVNLGFAEIYLRLMIDGIGSKPFSAVTLPPIPQPAVSVVGKVIEDTRKNYASPRGEVEKAISKWYEPVPVVPKEKKPKTFTQGASSGNTPFSNAERKPFSAPFVNRESRPAESAPKIAAPAHPTPQPVTPKVEVRIEDKKPNFAVLEKKPEENKPFAKAFAEVKVALPNSENRREEKPQNVSLSELKKKSEGVVSQNVSALKHMLDQAMHDGKMTGKVVVPGSHVPKPANENKKPHEEIKTATPKEERAPRPKEIPEEVLRKLLGHDNQ
jgi:hypothetical protein